MIYLSPLAPATPAYLAGKMHGFEALCTFSDMNQLDCLAPGPSSTILSGKQGYTDSHVITLNALKDLPRISTRNN